MIFGNHSAPPLLGLAHDAVFLLLFVKQPFQAQMVAFPVRRSIKISRVRLPCSFTQYRGRPKHARTELQ